MIKYPGQKSIFPIKNGVNLCRLIRGIQKCAYFWSEAARSMKYQFWPHRIVKLKQCALVILCTFWYLFLLGLWKLLVVGTSWYFLYLFSTFWYFLVRFGTF